MRQIRDHGQSARYQHCRLGLNGRMDTIQAAVLLAKLAVFDQELASRADAARRYSELMESAEISQFRVSGLWKHTKDRVHSYS